MNPRLDYYQAVINRGGGPIPAGQGLVVLVAPGPTPPADLKGGYVPLETATAEIVRELVEGLKSHASFPEKMID